jgi:hypothetical protein
VSQLALPLLAPAAPRPEAAHGCRGCPLPSGTVVITDRLGGKTEWCRELCSSWARAEWVRFARETGLPRGAHPAFGFGGGR